MEHKRYSSRHNRNISVGSKSHISSNRNSDSFRSDKSNPQFCSSSKPRSKAIKDPYKFQNHRKNKSHAFIKSDRVILHKTKKDKFKPVYNTWNTPYTDTNTNTIGDVK